MCKKKNEKTIKKNIIENTMDQLIVRKKAPVFGYFLLSLLYIAASAIISLTAGNQTLLNFGGNTIAVYAFAGVFAALSNIFIIFIAVYYRKLGFYTALLFTGIQLVTVLLGIFKQHNLSSLPGAFTNAFTFIAAIIIFVNNMRLEKFQERLCDQAVTDRLTELPNRFACSELLNELIRRSEKFAIVSIDLNNFKSINDTLGHNAGNAVLTEIAKRWKNAADTEESGTLDFVTRQGGDEFSLIIRNYRSDADIIRTIKYYENVLGKRLTVDECDLFMTASFGYAEYPADAKTSDALFSCADAAMYEIKRINSSDHIMRFSPEMLKTEHTLEMEKKIRTALDDGKVFFKLQPQYDLSHKLRGFEALARIEDTDGQILTPSEFVPVAEKVGLIDKIDLIVFRASAEFFGRLIRETGADIMLSVNVSVRHLMKNGFLEEVKAIVDSCGVPARQIEIEITESVMIDSAEKALNCINEIKKMGLKIAIDDFGTGYSSLSYLSDFPADLLKVDKSFIDKMNASDSSKKYVAAIISIGHIMNFKVISEGVEEPEQLETLKSIGCDYIQGFLWGSPMMPEEAGRLVKNSINA